MEVLTSGLIFPQLVAWYWSSPSTTSECDQLEPKRFGQIKQTCCFDFCRLSVWYSDGGVSVLLIPASGVTPAVVSAAYETYKTFLSCLIEAFSFFKMSSLIYSVMPCCLLYVQ